MLISIIVTVLHNVAAIVILINVSLQVAEYSGKPDEPFEVNRRGTHIVHKFTPLAEDQPYEVGRIFTFVCKGQC